MECYDSASVCGAEDGDAGWSSPPSTLVFLPRDGASPLGSSATHSLCPGARDANGPGQWRGEAEEEERSRGRCGESDERERTSFEELELSEGGREDGVVESEGERGGDGDGVESLQGEILYQTDGSAYVLESREGTPEFLLSSLSSSPHTSIINTCHISSSILHRRSPATPLPASGPALHSFRVFRLGQRDDTDRPTTGDSPRSVSRQSKDSFPDEAGHSGTRGQPPIGRSGNRPVLMCFLCRLSFGHARSFISHASQRHSVTLSDEERHLLSCSDTLSVLQPVGPGEPPLLGFLEPKNSSEPSPTPQMTSVPLEGRSLPGGKDGTDTQQASLRHCPLTVGVQNAPQNPTPTSAPHPAKDPQTLHQAPGREGSQRREDVEGWKTDRGMGREGGESLSCFERSSSEEAAFTNQSISKSLSVLSCPNLVQPSNSNRTATSFTDNTKSHMGSESQCQRTSFNCPAPSFPIAVTPEKGTAARDYGTECSPSPAPSFRPATDECANQENATATTQPNDVSERGNAIATEPNDPAEMEEDEQAGSQTWQANHPLSHLRGHTSVPPQSQSSLPGFEEGPSDTGSGGLGGSGGLVVMGDSVPSSSYSLGGSVTVMQSRNSCKTLKCPKCNWHYKYQQTLEAHMKEKHTESDSGQCPYCSTGQSHPRLARGETYTCGYKPFRCQVCQYSTTTKGNLSIHMQSDKHLHNMQNLQGGSEPAFTHAHAQALPSGGSAPCPTPTNALHPPHAHPPPHPTQATPQVGGTCSSPSPSKPTRGRAAWRCEVCDYETNVARNLRIHMTSEKHTHNILLLQQNLAHLQRQRGVARLAPHDTDLYHYYLSQTGPPSDRKPNPDAPRASRPTEARQRASRQGLFDCGLCGRFSSDSLEGVSQHLATPRSLPEAEWRSTAGDAHLCRLCQYATPLRANFQLHCQTDKHLQRYQLAAHLREAAAHRHGNSEEEDEEEEEWRLRCVAGGSPVQLRCNVCDYDTSSLEKLKLHTVSSRHDANLRLYKYLLQLDSVRSDGDWLHCVLCDYSAHSTLTMVQHSHSLSHQRGEGLRKLQRIQNGLQAEEEEISAVFTIRKCPVQDKGELNEVELADDSSADQEDQTKEADQGGGKEIATGQGLSLVKDREQTASSPRPKHALSGPDETDTLTPSSKHPRSEEEEGDEEETGVEQMLQCPFCHFCHVDVEHLRSHVMTQHAVQPTLRCPLCQETLRSVSHLRTHLMHLHSVTAECTQKLINTVIASDVLPDSLFQPVPGSGGDGPKVQKTAADLSSNGTAKPTEDSQVDTENRAPSPSDGFKPSQSPLDDVESTKENTATFPCCHKGCNKVFTTSSALQTHFNQTHNQLLQMPISDRHVYKYRCNQCSLAFKTPEKLQLHSQYHAIRAATMCCLCQRSFRSLQALRRHLETSHLELSDTQVQQLYGGILTNGDGLGSGDLGFSEEQGAPGDDGPKEEEESDPEEKPSPTGTDSALIPDESAPDPKHSILPLRKGPNLTMEKFLDPLRPFKCTVCKESFTQKNILLVHYNSVSHLHKVKRSLQDSSAGLMESVSSTDHKPFKCSICNVAYSQSSTLEIHMRSVLHQTKARAAKHDPSGSGTTSGSPVQGKVVSSTGSLTSGAPSALKSMTSTKNTSFTSPALGQTQLSQQLNTKNHVSSANSATASPSLSENSDAKRKILADIIASTAQQQQKLLKQQQLQQQQQQLAQAQAQLQQDLQQKAALLQSHLFNPALLQHFPVATEALLPLQQQQLLLPFLLPGGEFHLNPELKLKTSGLNISPAKLSPSTVPSESSKTDDPNSRLQQQKKGGDAVQFAPAAHLEMTAPDLKAERKIRTPQSENSRDGHSEKEISEKKDNLSSEERPNGVTAEDAEELLEGSHVSGENYQGFPLPRIAYDAPGNASRALLENIGFELVIQFNENKQHGQSKPAAVGPDGQDAKEANNLDVFQKLSCETCGKLFSNALILKTHQEHIHQAIFPIQSLERFAKDYREQYDKLFPLRPTSPEATPAPPSPTQPPPVPPPPPAPPQTQSIKPPSTSSIPACMTSASSAKVSALQAEAPMAPVPLPMDLPLFPPLVMHPVPIPSLPPQVPVQQPPLDVPLNQDLAHLYQSQLTPAMLQQQGKRPRTRITDEQLTILRQYFNINNSPNEDQILEMANKSGLPHKVIKHWFRNTLFKERQRNKDSPYNFNNPPITTLEDVKVDPRPPSPENLRQENYGGKRCSRTRFSDYQLRVLQDFFDANAYPKDDEFEQLSSLLSLSTRVIVVWFQNARQKARKNYENQGDGSKEGERRELSNDRYIRTSSNNYECKKCSMVFQRIFDLINHQKRLCYRDEDEDTHYDSQSEDSADNKHDDYSPFGSSCLTPTPSCSGLSGTTELNTIANAKSPVEELSQTVNASDTNTEKLCPSAEASSELQLDNSTGSEKPHTQTEQPKLPCEEKHQTHPKTPRIHSPPTSHQQQHPNPPVSQTSPVPSTVPLTSINSLVTPGPLQKLPQQVTPYHCIQCKVSFPSFEHWQEHQQLHFLAAQNQFIPPQFLDRPLDIPFVMFDPTNPLLTSQLLSGAFPQIPTNAPSSPAIPDSLNTINSLKRKLEEKAGSSMDNDWDNNGEEPQRDKRMRTTITPEQLEVLYQKYLLDSNPTRKMLDHISSEVGLKKRVVQVWFQNTRARERKGQFRALGPAQAHRRCPFCRALFKAQTALDAHIRSRHWHEAKSTGYTLPVSFMPQDQEDSQVKMDPLDFSSYSHFSNLNNNLINLSSSDEQHYPISPASRCMDLSSNQRRLSPRPLKIEETDDIENLSVSPGQKAYEQSKPDEDENSPLNMAQNNTTVPDDGSCSAEAKHNSSPLLSPTAERDASSENDDKMSLGLVSPAMSFSAKDFENDMVVDYSENSSLADPASPCPGGSSSQSMDGDRQGQKRYRTQMTNLQVKVLKACFNDYKTPTMLECEALGNEIGLPKRVVQVWFQNARAKEKKAKLSLAKQFGGESSSTERPRKECTLCGVRYSGCLSVRDHVFSSQHLANVKEALGGQMEKEREYLDPGIVRQLMVQQEVDRVKKASEVLGVAQTVQRPGAFDQLAPVNPSSAYSSLQSVAAAGLPGISFTSQKSGASQAPSNGLTRRNPVSSATSFATSDKDLAHTGSSVSSPKDTQPDLKIQLSKENLSESKERLKEKTEQIPTGNDAHPTSAGTSKEKPDTSATATPAPKSSKEFEMDVAQLQALQAAMVTDPTSLLTNPFLPCLMPGFPPYFQPQIPGALPGGFLQPMYGMEGVFPYGPALSQPVIGLSPGSILHQYQQYQHTLQGALQLQQQRLQLQQKQQQQLQKPKASQTPVPLHTQDMSSTKEPVLELEKTGASSNKHSTASSQHLSSKQTLPSKQPDIANSLSSQDCRERGEGGCLHDCLVCETSFRGKEELSRHLESPEHKHRVAERQNAKEHAIPLLPRTTTCNPAPYAVSTSQSNSPNNQITPTVTLSKTAVLASSLSSSSSSCTSTPTDVAQQTTKSHSPQTLSLSRALPGASDPSFTSASPSPQSLSPLVVTSSSTGLAAAHSPIPTDHADDDQRPVEGQSKISMKEGQEGKSAPKDCCGYSSYLSFLGTDSVGL